MALSDVIAMVIEKSGRADLDVDPWTTAVSYINAGQKLLDKLLLPEGLKGRRFVELAAGSLFTYIKYCRSIDEIWLYDGDGRVKLTKKELTKLKRMYHDPTSTLTPGKPAYFAFEYVRPIGDSTDTPETISDLSVYSQQWAVDGVKVDGTWAGYSTILTAPKSDAAYTMEIVGMFDSIPLDTVNNTTSFWTENHPLLLAWAALYHMEVDMRNTEGAKDWMSAVMDTIMAQNMDIVEREVDGRDSIMEG